MKQKINSKILNLKTKGTLFLIASLFPTFVGAARLITCTGTDCEYKHFVSTFENIVRYILGLAVSAIVIVFALAGWKYLNAKGKADKIKEANKMFTNAAIGFLIAISAFFIVELLVRDVFKIRPDIIDLKK